MKRNVGKNLEFKYGSTVLCVFDVDGVVKVGALLARHLPLHATSQQNHDAKHERRLEQKSCEFHSGLFDVPIRGRLKAAPESATSTWLADIAV